MNIYFYKMSDITNIARIYTKQDFLIKINNDYKNRGIDINKYVEYMSYQEIKNNLRKYIQSLFLNNEIYNINYLNRKLTEIEKEIFIEVYVYEFYKMFKNYNNMV